MPWRHRRDEHAGQWRGAAVLTDVVTTVDLLRHGEPVGGRRFRGAVDDPLSERGWAQMRAAVADHRPWDAVVTSPLRRCAAFAGELSARHGLPLEVEPALREISFGAWDGCLVTEVEEQAGKALQRFWRDPVGHPPPGGEPLMAFRERVLGVWQTLLSRRRRQHVLVVAHGGAIRVMLAHVLDMPPGRIWRLEVPYASLSRICIRDRGDGAEPEPVLSFHAGRLP